MSILLILLVLIIVGVCCAALGSRDKSNNSYTNKRTRIRRKNYNTKPNVNWKKCPDCGHKINNVAKKCPYCDYKFEGYNSSDAAYKFNRYCPDCGRKLSESAKKCSFCGYDFSPKAERELSEKKLNEIKDLIKNSTSNTKHIKKNGLSFDYPKYYDIGSYQDSDEFHKSIVALSKSDRACEIYVMEYKSSHFDNNARKNIPLLKEYLKMQGYTNIVQNKSLPYCFDATINSDMGRLKTTIVYNFNYSDVIMIVCNIAPDTDYTCIHDLRVIDYSVKSI